MQDGTPLDASVFTYDETSTTLSIYTNDYLKSGTYDMQVTATYGPGPLQNALSAAAIPFEVVIGDPCSVAGLTIL